MTSSTIVVIESDPSVRQLFDEVLHDEGYSVRLLELAALCPRRLSSTAPDLLLVEVTPANSPQVLALVGQLRQRPETAWLPVLVSTTDQALARSRAADMRRLGCEVLLKPFGLDGMLAMVSSSLGRPEAPPLVSAG